MFSIAFWWENNNFSYSFEIVRNLISRHSCAQHLISGHRTYLLWSLTISSFISSHLNPRLLSFHRMLFSWTFFDVIICCWMPPPSFPISGICKGLKGLKTRTWSFVNYLLKCVSNLTLNQKGIVRGWLFVGSFARCPEISVFLSSWVDFRRKCFKWKAK